jgi:tetratricopeptide (TPR) repeat protein
MEKAVRFAEQAFKAQPENTDTMLNMVATDSLFANMLVDLQEPAAALVYARHGAALGEALHRKNPANQRWRREYQNALGSAGIAHLVLSRSDPQQISSAVQFLERVHSLALKTAQEDASNARAKDDVVVHSQRLALALTQAGRFGEALLLYEQAAGVAHGLVALNPQNRHFWYLLISTQCNYGKLRLDQRHAREAEKLLLSAGPAFDQALALDPFDTILLDARASQFYWLAVAAEKLGELQTAEGRIVQCLEVLTGMLGRDASVKGYITEYKGMLTLAHRLGVSTRNLPSS